MFSPIRFQTSAPYIFETTSFSRWVVTHSWADYNLHVHWPTILNRLHSFCGSYISPFKGILITLEVKSSSPTLLTNFGPQQNQLVKLLSYIYTQKICSGNYCSLHSLMMSQEIHFPIHSLQPLHFLTEQTPILKFLRYPWRNFSWNQLLGGSMSLSLPYQTLTSDLHVNNNSNFHYHFKQLHRRLT